MLRWRQAASVLVFELFAACQGRTLPERQPGPNEPSLGAIDAPVANSVVGPVFTVSGWAGDTSGVDRVRIYLDDQIVASVRVAIARPDIEAVYPALKAPGAIHGFQAQVDVGSHGGYRTLREEVLDTRGALTYVASVTVRVEP